MIMTDHQLLIALNAVTERALRLLDVWARSVSKDFRKPDGTAPTKEECDDLYRAYADHLDLLMLMRSAQSSSSLPAAGDASAESGPDESHAAKLKRIEVLMRSPDVTELDALTSEVEAYEKERFPTEPVTLSEAIVFRRQQTGETRKEMSERASLSLFEWKRLESGQDSPDIRQARGLYRVGIPASIILGE